MCNRIKQRKHEKRKILLTITLSPKSSREPMRDIYSNRTAEQQHTTLQLQRCMDARQRLASTSTTRKMHIMLHMPRYTTASTGYANPLTPSFLPLCAYRGPRMNGLIPLYNIQGYVATLVEHNGTTSTATSPPAKTYMPCPVRSSSVGSIQKISVTCSPLRFTHQARGGGRRKDSPVACTPSPWQP